ncbi:MAG TPA: hypothetical protein VFY16_04810 [Gemmatimonadaceae bacterium]|nr:hypothetical protein [Gemmatimonadaceae bacterium]
MLAPLRRSASLAGMPLVLAVTPLVAQHAPDASWAVGAQAVGMVTHADPAHLGEARTEGSITQPALMGHWAPPGGWLRLTGTLNLEAFTLRDGELNPGIAGEGFVDRRHPHTFVHELIATASVAPAGWALSLSAGKGFVAFGTDDPMSRPFVKYPANHHLAQILERLVAVAGVRRGAVILEGTLFNGDEPTGVWSWPEASRFGDSWAARLTVRPAAGLELSGSLADVASPEQPAGGGFDQRKRSLAARWARADAGGPRHYALVEWARTDDVDDGHRAFSFESALVEGMTRIGPVDVAARWERTERPEEERTADPFRSPRPHPDLNVLGITEWHITTLHVGSRVELPAGVRIRPFVEAARLRARALLEPTIFEPAAFYGREWQWSLSLGARVEMGTIHGRMGRYGVTAAPASGSSNPRHEHQHASLP